jgi:glyoxylase-like metal-dependent hydrolase (beta-lactamase superfamily II)
MNLFSKSLALTHFLMPIFAVSFFVSSPSQVLADVATDSLPARTAGRLIEFESGPEGFNTKTYFYEGRSEVVAIDAQFTPALAKQAIARLRTFTTKPIRYLIISHPNPDKFNGANVFQAEGARLISSAQTAAAIPEVQKYKENYFVNVSGMFKKGQYPKPPTVDQTFSSGLELKLDGGETLALRELAKPGVSSSQTVVYIPGLKALLVGDLVHHKAHAWLEGGIVAGKPTPTLAGWIADLLELQASYPAQSVVYGGRGDTGLLSTVMTEQIDYLRQADRIVTDYVAQLGDRKGELLSTQAPTHYQNLQKIFEAAFPDYRLGYMIQYGVYGLLNAKL